MIDVILPVLNERHAIPWVMDRMPQGFTPIVVDNGSSDGSPAIAQSLGARVVSEPRRGFGAACWRGLNSATTDVVCFMDCDGSLDPAALPLVVGPIHANAADLVLGARHAAPGAWPRHARVANRLLAFEIRRRTGVVLHDLGPMRATRRQPLLDLDLQDRRSGWPLEMVLKAVQNGWRVAEVAVEYRPRTGTSKVTGSVKGTVGAIADMVKVLQ
jgi:glycosyltransferase involved in cell wall biosynthesis